jgi:hypothetical protein
VETGDETLESSQAGAAGVAFRLAWIAVYSFALLLALRFGGRTYPGWYFPDSSLLNWLLNIVRLFTDVGYSLVLIGATAAALRVWLGPRAPRILRFLQWTAFALVILIILYGIQWAIWTERLPWQPDGQGRYPPFVSLSA